MASIHGSYRLYPLLTDQGLLDCHVYLEASSFLEDLSLNPICHPVPTISRPWIRPGIWRLNRSNRDDRVACFFSGHILRRTYRESHPAWDAKYVRRVRGNLTSHIVLSRAFRLPNNRVGCLVRILNGGEIPPPLGIPHVSATGQEIVMDSRRPKYPYFQVLPCQVLNFNYPHAIHIANA